MSADTYSFTFPSCVPDGEYLLRIEQLGIHKCVRSHKPDTTQRLTNLQ